MVERIIKEIKEQGKSWEYVFKRRVAEIVKDQDKTAFELLDEIKQDS
jgi:hypothetical protein